MHWSSALVRFRCWRGNPSNSIGGSCLEFRALHSVLPQRSRATTTDCSSCSPLPRGKSARTVRATTRRHCRVGIDGRGCRAARVLSAAAQSRSCVPSAFWSPPQWVNIPDFYEDLLTPAVVPARRDSGGACLLARRLGPATATAILPASPLARFDCRLQGSCSFRCSRWSSQRSPPAHSSIDMRLQRSSALVHWPGLAQRWPSGAGRRFN